MKVKGIKSGEISFDIDQDGFKFVTDAKKEFGGEGKGPSPKGLLLSGLIGCTGMDVVSMLKKMRVNYDKLEITASADVTNEHPKVFTDITLVYSFEGADIDSSKVKRAISLSMEKYCGVSAMLKEGDRKVISELYINGSSIG
ncbi:MAG: osmotically inducible protein C [Candidatus Cloacimonadota bacterium]|nr:MAG: osmotically inducible protein C [Candidatus Cloacimonadota bacterium]PIE78759.1 MAG: osmotically inducible protein C [Candidatus Delongbacteria bacterium]